MSNQDLIHLALIILHVLCVSLLVVYSWHYPSQCLWSVIVSCALVIGTFFGVVGPFVCMWIQLYWCTMTTLLLRHNKIMTGRFHSKFIMPIDHVMNHMVYRYYAGLVFTILQNSERNADRMHASFVVQYEKRIDRLREVINSLKAEM